MNFLIACGGTAGHINPALAIAVELRKRIPGSKILFVGAGRALEKTMIPRAGFHVINIKMSGLRRGISPKDMIYNVKTAKNVLTAGIQAGKLLKRFNPNVVIGTGGYICYPILKCAARLKIPTIIHDSNAVPGLTTKSLSSIVDKVLVSFPNQENLYNKPERVVFTGTPIREDFKLRSIFCPFRDKRELPLVVSFWGSLGAEHLNKIIADVIKLNIKSRTFDHIHAVGKKHGKQEVKSFLKQVGVSKVSELPKGIEIREYIENMPGVMTCADLIICRGGGSTIAELIELDKPAVIIPSPYVANNEQEYNARQISNVGGAVLLDENTCTGDSLYGLITSLLSDKEKLVNMAENIKTITAGDTTDNVVNIILSLAKAR